MQNGFKFNINQCVACHACVLACQIEHFDLDEIISPENWKEHNAWREVKSFNEFQFPDLPVFNFSMACNHCKEAPCMENCPALAYNSNTSFNAIIHQVDACIGCQYCTMVCPYNAPKYNPFKGVVEKCTLCLNRLKNELKTACATSCPTGALDFVSILISPQYVNGFQEFGIKPAIEITDLRKTAALKTDNSYSQETIDYIKLSCDLEKRKPNRLISDWPLLVFSLLSTLLVSFFYVSFSKGLLIKPEVFLSISIISAFFSFAHLGKKIRAWRVLLNLRKSWLSREIFAYSLFVPIASFWLYFPNQNELGLIATVLGLLVLVSIDNVYRRIPSRADSKYHSADVLFFTSFLYVAVLVSNPWMFFAAIALKAYLYINRKLMFWKNGADYRLYLSILRMFLGLIIPVALFWILGFETGKLIIFVSILLGEIIDRSEFYLELK